jgi:hypothetical protein
LLKTLHAFTAKGDILECISVVRSDSAQVCEFCGHSPIYWLHRLKNLRSGKVLVAGSQCIINFQRVHLEMYREPLRIQAQEKLREVSEKINTLAQGAITIIPNDPEVDWEDEVGFLNYNHDDEEIDDIDPSEGASEGLGSDEIDWDNPGVIPPHDPVEE